MSTLDPGCDSKPSEIASRIEEAEGLARTLLIKAEALLDRIQGPTNKASQVEAPKLPTTGYLDRLSRVIDALKEARERLDEIAALV